MRFTLKKALLLILPLTFFMQSCWIYSFSGASIPANMKTFSVSFFENTAPLVVPYLSQQFTEALKERVRNQSGLSMVRENADGTFEGRITDYSIKPVAVTADERAGLSRLTITVNVKFTNTVDNEYSFEQSFTRYTDFDIQARSLQQQEPEMIRLVTQMLTEDIFNRAFANW
ncbi:LptE family protein [Pedobacter sp. SYSU D00535]|uniref:LptE family protein n=1 Tax=Pedobacter sp. SYSU D00535 TaxID=2810308 RepID=UPI001A9655D0|nr:LptE family protein [Pedobacter sp. SYSU D00535]